MATRRSARIRNMDATVPSEPPVSVSPKPKAKRKVPAPARDTVKKKKPATASATAKTKESTVQAELDPDNTSLPTLPPEMMELILDNIHDASTIGKLARTCKQFHAMMTPRLHKRVAVAASYHAHIAKLIEHIQPYLSIAQNKQLKRDGTYKGQQARYPSAADAQAVPPCADYVRELIVGNVDPGKKHEYIVHRYVEEAVRSMRNLEIVELNKMTSALAQSVAALKNLKALSLLAKATKDSTDTTPLSKVKDLQHFEIRSHSYYSIESDFVQATTSILLNSRSTLRSLSVQGNSSWFNFLHEWGRKIGSQIQRPHFPALRSLHLASVNWDDGDLAESFKLAVDLMKLDTLKIGRIYQGRFDLYRHLADLAASTPKADIKLRTFSIDQYANDGVDEIKRDMDTIFEFLGSFDSLTTLHMIEYNSYPALPPPPSGIPGPLERALLKHKNLRKLILDGRERDRGSISAYLSPEVLMTIMEELPLLEEFRFGARASDMTKVGEALARGKNLERIYWNAPRDDIKDDALLGAVLGAILNTESGNSGEKTPFRWEDHSKLRHVSTRHYMKFDIASRFGKVKVTKEAKKPERFTVGSNQQREVWYRDVSGLQWTKDAMYGPKCDWADEVARDMS